MKREDNFRGLYRKLRRRQTKVVEADAYMEPNGADRQANNADGVHERGFCTLLPEEDAARKARGGPGFILDLTGEKQPAGNRGAAKEKGGRRKAGYDATSPRARGERIRRLRLYWGMHTEQAARALGVSWIAYIGYENGTPVPADVLFKMVRLFGCSADFLLGLCDRPNGHFGEGVRRRRSF